jgi:glycosyltransferase involved in cell wall biosynthesis
VKLAVVVQRYGAAINGGAELHARYIAEHLARHVDIDVLTTCARDYITWRNELPAGSETLNGVTIRRFPVDHERDVKTFARRSDRVFTARHSHADEIAWLACEGPASTPLLQYVRGGRAAYDYFIFFSYRYHHAYHGVRAVYDRAILVPTAERDETIGLSAFAPIFRGVRAIMYNSPEERAMVTAASGNAAVPGVVVGVGSEIPEHPDPGRFRRKFGVTSRFAIYVGRIDENKGCKELFQLFLGSLASLPRGLDLVLIGNPVLPIPSHPRVRHLGFVSDEDKFDALAAADLLIMPSYYESLSMVTLEAWALGRPVVANGRCEVLRGQCIRSRAGLYYENQAEFIETLRAVAENRWLNAALGANGSEYYKRHYAWPIVEQKYLDMIEQLVRADRAGLPTRPIEPEPGWTTRWRRRIPAACDVLSALPAGAVVDPSEPAASGVGPNCASDVGPNFRSAGEHRGPRADRAAG